VGSTPTLVTEKWGRRPKGRHPRRKREIGVQLPAIPLNELKMGRVVRVDWAPVLQTGDRGSTPRRSTENALVVKRTIIPCFERGVPGSNPGRGTFISPNPNVILFTVLVFVRTLSLLNH
jgi:hypothetical protein